MDQTADEADLLTEVPDILERLVLTVMRTFYETEHSAIANLLVKHTCLKEDDLSDLTKFDKKLLRNVLAKLKSDKLVKQRVYKGKDDDGSTITFLYFFIDYKLFVNVVNYKLLHIRNKIEHDEREATNRPSFVCTECGKRYSDLDINRLLDPSTGQLLCEFCGGPTDEDTTDVEQKQNSRSLLARFNEQMERLFVLLQSCENIKLSPKILEPDPQLCMKQFAWRNSSSRGTGPKQIWTSTSKSQMTEKLYEHDIKINMGDEKYDEETRKAKETPVWISQSTVGPLDSNPTTSTESVEAMGVPQTANHEIMKDLLAHENKKAKLSEGVKSLQQDSSDESDKDVPAETSHVEGDQATHGESDDDEDITVKIGDKSFALDDITDEMIEKMTPEEHDKYMKACQEAFSNLSHLY